MFERARAIAADNVGEPGAVVRVCLCWLGSMPETRFCVFPLASYISSGALVCTSTRYLFLDSNKISGSFPSVVHGLPLLT
jgi:hypothetical protein